MSGNPNRLTLAALAGCLAIGGAVLFAEDKPAAQKSESSESCMTCMPAEGVAKDTMDKLKSLAGTWTKEKDGQTLTITFHPIAGGSAVVETMFPGTPKEMVNVYHADGQSVMVTHYCAMGVQPRMRLDSNDPKAMKFNFLDCTNLKSRNDAHMDSLELKIEGDKLTENWSYFKDGKVIENTTFELKRQAPQS